MAASNSISTQLLWTQPDWRDEAQRWLTAVLAQHHLTLLEPPDQFHVRSWSTVMRLVTSGGTYYFKASAPELAHEAALTQALAGWHPDSLPHILAAEPERGWLLMAAGGNRLRELIAIPADTQHWEAILPRYASLQIDLATRQDALGKLGVPDRRLHTLTEQFDQLRRHTAVTDVPPPNGLTSQEHRYLQEAAVIVSQLCARLESAPVPESLDHSDLHGGNVFVEDGRYRIFDWGDAALTHPFFSLHATFRSIRYTFDLTQDDPVCDELRDVYLAPWTHFAPLDDLRQIFGLAQRLAPILAALRWLPALSLLAGNVPERYEAAVPNLMREFLALNE